MGPAGPLIACSALAAGALVVRGDRARAWLLLGSLLLAPAILLVHVADSDQVRTLRDQPALAVAAGVLGLALVDRAGRRVRARADGVPDRRRRHDPVPDPDRGRRLVVEPAAAAVSGGRGRGCGVGGAARTRPLAGQVGRADLSARPSRRAPKPAWLERLLALALVLYAVQSAYSGDDGRALENVVFFYVPFAVMYVLLVRLEWTSRLAAISLGVLTGLAVALASIGYVEFATRHLLLNPKVIASNQLEDYFRVNSLFFDPNIYGRFLAIVLVLLVAWMLWRVRTRDVALGALVRGVPVRRPRADALAVELRGAARRARRARRAALERALGARHRRGGRPRGARGVRARHDRVRRRQQFEQGDERSCGPDLGRRPPLHRPAGPGLGLRVVRSGVPAPRARLGRARHLRLAHDPGDGRRRAGPDRPARLPRAARARVRAALPRRGRRPRAGRRRGRVRGARRALVHVRRVPRGSADLGAARRRHGRRRRGGPARAGARRSPSRSRSDRARAARWR